MSKHLNIQTNQTELTPEEERMERLKGTPFIIASIVAVIISLFVLVASSFLNIQEFYRNTIFIMLITILAFFLYPNNKKDKTATFGVVDVFWIILTIASFGYILFAYTDLHVNRMSQAHTTDYVFAILCIVVLFEITRRAIGWFIPLLSIFAMVYAVYGVYFPIDFAHSGFSLKRLLFRIYMTSSGIFGNTLSIASTYIVLFVIFGAFLSASGASRLFNDLALAIAGQRRGGPAQVAVLTSALTGTLNGSAVANVATTGAFTIPLMKSIGLKPRFAGGVEAAASTGGMIMPPIMGAAAFIMAGFLGVPYTVVVIAGIIPALLYYIALIFAVDTEAKKQGLKGISKDNIPDVKAVLIERGALLLPIIVVFAVLLMGRTAIFAGFAGIITSIIVSYLTKDKSNRITLPRLFVALREGAIGSIQVAIACAVVGIIIAVVSMTGVGSMLAYNVIDLAGGNLFLILVMVMITCIILSFGLPSTALYIVVAVTAAPALVQAGVSPLAAHFFVFYFGAMSNVTPPVALAAYTAAGIANADPVETSWTALRLALPGFIIPFIIAYDPIILLDAGDEGVNYVRLLFVFLTALVGIYALAVGLGGFLKTRLNIVEKVLFVVTALLLITTHSLTDVVGIILFALLVAFHIIKSKRTAGVA
ncbi:TRAP transporter permease [Nosocomiicoccus sp. HMSC09A07]|uniref:TRAP transporter permease n=1 Tax=Nosocomiicoccus sp. HMSC09A07 TaxID=1581145 RepID=UPI0008A62993|nr:TRAP transporter permease [Nosocomiicoccus sp. HMSC09A07]OFS62751.1 C4-dicarboxylate ABC transporter permease [Nosocomiicoccus sp. HMSC09A07]